MIITRNLRAILAATPPRALLLLGALFAVLLVLPAFLDRYLLAVMILVLRLAYTGQAWNVMMGFCGQLSLGHALYIGLGGYVSGVLFVHYGVPPLVGVVPAMLIAAAFGAALGWLGFRFGIEGVYFALLTIAFAEVTRIGFDNWGGIGGSAGFFFPARAANTTSWWNLHGDLSFFYYVALALTAAGFLIAAMLRHSKLGLAFLAVREDPEAARALGIDVFRTKMMAIMVSSAMTAAAGVFNAFYNGSLFPSEVFDISRSIGIMLGPIIGGLGTLMGPIVGALILAPLGEALIALIEAVFGHAIPGANLLVYGVCLMLIVSFAPNGVWPFLKRALRIPEERQ